MGTRVDTALKRIGLAVFCTAALTFGVRAGDEGQPAAPPTTAEGFVANGVDLGPPLVTNLDQLKRLDPNEPVWIDPQHKQVVLVGSVCNTENPLELFACLAKSKEYESLVSIATKARLVQAALLAVGAHPGSPVQYEPFAPPTGTPISILLVWNDDKGQRHKAPAQHWIRKAGTQKAMEQAWVFAGSRFLRDEEGQEVFQADLTGELISVSNFPASVLDVPVQSTTADAALLFVPFTERIPRRGSPVTLILSPDAAEAKRGKTGEKKLLR